MVPSNHIKQKLASTFNDQQADVLAEVVTDAYNTLVKADDFSELKAIVAELAAAQQRTEQRIGELAAAQQRTEQRIEELATAQQRTEQRIGELAAAQQRTEQRIEELATQNLAYSSYSYSLVLLWRCVIVILDLYTAGMLFFGR